MSCVRKNVNSCVGEDRKYGKVNSGLNEQTISLATTIYIERLSNRELYQKGYIINCMGSSNGI